MRVTPSIYTEGIKAHNLETALTRPALAQAASGESAGVRVLAEDFDAVVREHQQRIYRVLNGVLRDEDAADSLTQECFLRAWQQRAGFRGEASVATWLRRIAVNLAIDHQRNRRAGFWRRLFSSQPADAEVAAEHVGVEGPEEADPDGVGVLEVVETDGNRIRKLAEDYLRRTGRALPQGAGVA